MSTQALVDETVEAVRADLLERSKIGIAKYGVTLDRTDLNLRDWLQHAYEETLDQANYLKRAILDMDVRADLEGQGCAIGELADRIMGELFPNARGSSFMHERRRLIELLVLAQAEAPERAPFGPLDPEALGDAEDAARTRRPFWRRLFPNGE